MDGLQFVKAFLRAQSTNLMSSIAMSPVQWPPCVDSMIIAKLCCGPIFTVACKTKYGGEQRVEISVIHELVY